MYKKIILFLIAVLIIVLVFRSPFYNKWYNDKFENEYEHISYEMDHMAPEERMESRFGSTYIIQKKASIMLNNVNAQNVVVLLPPQGIVDRQNSYSHSFTVPEPAVFYYFTGYRAVTKNSPEVSTANWAMMADGGKIALRRIPRKNFVDSLLKMYQPYK